jgi:hypothetical protein
MWQITACNLLDDLIQLFRNLEFFPVVKYERKLHILYSFVSTEVILMRYTKAIESGNIPRSKLTKKLLEDISLA